MGYRKLTPDARRELGRQRTAELADLLQAGYAAMGRRDVWAAVMRAGAVHLNHRGAVNAIAIGLQAPEATRVLGYRAWQDEGRQVRKGETGIRIWGPMRGRREDEASTPEDPEPQDEAPARGWVANAVFDISQTDGPPITPRPISGSPAQVVRNRLIAALTAQGDHRAFLINGVPAEAIDPEDASRALLLKVARTAVESTGGFDAEQVEAEAAAASHVAARILKVPPGPLLVPPSAGWITADPKNPPVKASAVRAITVGRSLAQLIGDVCPCCDGTRHAFDRDRAEA
ncbi:ArdC family protein [Streptomyces sp. NPDC058677]|uniref:ArdC family protein n=1 Tax=Streptomyces sp. NPDC058677 TaxID=3346594 RepID=UPI003646FAEC